MGGLPCYQKVLIDGRTQQLLQNYASETQITLNLLTAKGFYDAPILEKFMNLDKEVVDFIKSKLSELQSLNNEYAQEE